MKEQDGILSIDKMRIQTANPCEGWDGGESPSIDLFKANIVGNHVNSVTQQSIIVDNRTNCNENKIIAWFKPDSNGVRNREYDFGNNSPQVVLRVVGNCLTTEVRDLSSITTFERKRYITSDTGDFGVARLYCGCNRASCVQVSPDDSCCCLGFSSYSNFGIGTPYPAHDKSTKTPCGDISYNRDPNNTKEGLYSDTEGDLFVEYGTEKKNNSGNIESGCITDTSDIYFLYIPCGHYTRSDIEGLDNNGPGIIEDDAFSNLENLMGVYIDGKDGIGNCFRYGENTNPFSDCRNIQIVYCPDSWVNYFKCKRDGQGGFYFRDLRYINDIYITPGSNRGC